MGQGTRPFDDDKDEEGEAGGGTDRPSSNTQYPDAMVTRSTQTIDTQHTQILDSHSQNHRAPEHPDPLPRPQLPPIINIHYPQTMDIPPRSTTTHTLCPTCRSQMQEGDEDGGTKDTDEEFCSRPEERAQLRFRRLSQALKFSYDTDEEHEAGGGTWGAPQPSSKMRRR